MLAIVPDKLSALEFEAVVGFIWLLLLKIEVSAGCACCSESLLFERKQRQNNIPDFQFSP